MSLALAWNQQVLHYHVHRRQVIELKLPAISSPILN